MTNRRFATVVALALALLLGACAETADLAGPTVVTVDSPSPLLQIRLMVGVGSASEQVGMEPAAC